MKESKDYSTRTFWDILKNPWLENPWLKKPLTYIVAGILTIPVTIGLQKDYYKDMHRYQAGEIEREPNISHYTPIGRLERFIFDNDEIKN